MDFKDKKIVCVECEKVFLFTAGEQEFYKGKGFDDPKRCKVCRQARNNKKGAEVHGKA